ncbi:MAG: recombinase family protein [Syntrophobacteraceae bacterium]
MQVIGYLRVSSTDQDLSNCKNQILHFANEKRLGSVTWIEETVSGTVDWKQRELGKVLQQLSPGDIVITAELSRFARSLRQIIEVVEYCKLHRITLHAIKGAWTIDDSLNSKVCMVILGLVSEIERDLISLRTTEALAARKKAGVKLGRPKGPGKSRLDPFRPEIVALLRNGSPKSFVARRYQVSEPTLWNWLAKNQIDATPRLERLTA